MQQLLQIQLQVIPRGSGLEGEGTSSSSRVGSLLTSTGLHSPKSESFMCPLASSSRLSGFISLRAFLFGSTQHKRAVTESRHVTKQVVQPDRHAAGVSDNDSGISLTELPCV